MTVSGQMAAASSAKAVKFSEFHEHQHSVSRVCGHDQYGRKPGGF
jgi:hypothetical protein